LCETVAGRAACGVRPGHGALTQRQRAIADLVCRGLTNPEIASVLGISRNTVRNQLAVTFRRLGVSTRAELVAVLLQR
jgi:DNA-binding NarL/FixJ family response regulator